jgi:hypothetical protein
LAAAGWVERWKHGTSSAENTIPTVSRLATIRQSENTKPYRRIVQYLKARLFKTRVVGTCFAPEGGVECTAQDVAW